MTAVSVVTGAGGAMGAACARVFAKDSVLVLTDIDNTRLEATADTIDGELVCLELGDLSDEQFVTGLAAHIASLGQLHAVVHTAGLSPSMAAWQEILRVDLIATARLLEAFLPHVVPGTVAVCLASIAAHLGDFDPVLDDVLAQPLAPGFVDRYRELAAPDGAEPDPGATYRLAKRGVIKLCERGAPAWGQRGGRVLSVSPGLIDTDMGRLELQHQPVKTWMAQHTPVQRFPVESSPLPGRVDDIANAVAFLCSDQASFISGCDIRVDGGLIPAMNPPTNQHG
jgi:NAD(P)-dependent dehydrogenase (short-subunit alcohol dehydrogenase family)